MKLIDTLSARREARCPQALGTPYHLRPSNLKGRRKRLPPVLRARAAAGVGAGKGQGG